MDGSLPLLGFGCESTWDDIREEATREIGEKEIKMIEEITKVAETTPEATSVETLSKVRAALDEIVEKNIQVSIAAPSTSTTTTTTTTEQVSSSSSTSSGIQKAKSALLTLARVINALPMFSYEVAKRAGVSERTARAALVFATVGDYFIPVVFSAAVVVTATIIRPSSPVDTVTDLIRGIRSRVVEIARNTGSS